MKINYVLTNEHFEMFKVECKKHLNRFGLQSWKVYYRFVKLDNIFGQCRWDYEGRVATISLAKVFPKPFDDLERQIKEVALHECLELLLSPLDDLASCRRFDSNEYEKEVHMIIRTLEKLLIEEV